MADYATVTLLSTEIATNTGWSADIQGSEDNQPTYAIKPFDAAWTLDPDSYTMVIADDDSSTVRVAAQTNRAIEYASGACFPAGRGNLWVWYKAGYTLPTDASPVTGGSDNVPDGLALIVNQIVQDTLDMSKHDGTLLKEKIGNYSYEMGKNAQEVTDKYWNDLSAYARRTV